MADLKPCPHCGEPPRRVVQADIREVEGDPTRARYRKNFVARCGNHLCPERPVVGVSSVWQVIPYDDVPPADLPEDEAARAACGNMWDMAAITKWDTRARIT